MMNDYFNVDTFIDEHFYHLCKGSHDNELKIQALYQKKMMHHFKMQVMLIELHHQTYALLLWREQNIVNKVKEGIKKYISIYSSSKAKYKNLQNYFLWRKVKKGTL